MRKPPFFLSLLMLICICSAICAQPHLDYLGAGHSIGVKVSSSSDEGESNAAHTIDGWGMRYDEIGTSRFLGQATFGANMEEIERVREIGISSWINEEFEKPAGSYLDHLISQVHTRLDWQELYYGEDHINSEEFELGIYGGHFRQSWWDRFMTEDDYLRQRIAFCLSQIFVISGSSEIGDYGLSMASFYDILYQNAFGNYRDILHQVSLHPAMGSFLSHLNNSRANPDLNTNPDENYAREIMQLFTIGLYELEQNGIRKADSNGAYIATYDNNDVKEYAKIFTGLGPQDWDQSCALLGLEGDFFPCNVNWGEGAAVSFGDELYSIDRVHPMKMYNFYHETSSKTLLGDEVIPPGQDGLLDIEMAVNNLFNHSNVGPFIGKRLIQFLVKSNPSPQYVERVAAAFADNGQGVRGDMKSVIRSILLDTEARDCEWIEHASNGKLREPLLRRTQLLKAFNAYNDMNFYWKDSWVESELLMQSPLDAPSVFNFYSPFHQPNGQIFDAGLVAPEFQIHNAITSIRYVNLMGWCAWNPCYEVSSPLGYAEEAAEWFEDNYGEEKEMKYELEDLYEIATDADLLLDRLNLLLAHGNLSQETIDAIKIMIDPLSGYADDNPEDAVHMAIYFVMISPDYTILK